MTPPYRWAERKDYLESEQAFGSDQSLKAAPKTVKRKLRRLPPDCDSSHVVDNNVESHDVVRVDTVDVPNETIQDTSSVRRSTHGCPMTNCYRSTRNDQ